jgi:DNA polymerase-3 subunit alpha
MKYPGSLHNHSEYSNLRLRDSIIRTKDLMNYAGELGYEVIAITEHETVSNAIKLEKEYKKVKEKYPNLKLIRGNEIYLCRTGLNAENFDKNTDKYYHFILLAKDPVGHQQIRELSTRAWSRSYVTQGKMRRVPTYYEDLIEIIGSNPGHVIGSTACLGGFLGTQILKWVVAGRPQHLYDSIADWLKRVENIFGTGNFYLEMQPSANDEQVCVNQEIVNLCKITNIPYIITTDSHYLKKEDASIHKAFLNSQDGDREVDSFYATTYLMGTEELESYLKYLTKEQLDYAYQNILNIRNMCEDYSLLKELNIPSLNWGETPTYSPRIYNTWVNHIPWLEKFLTSNFEGDKVMANLIIQKLINNPTLQNQTSYAALDENLRMTWVSSEVNKAHWSAYFLNLRGILDTCWEAGTLVGPGRGSGVGFYLLYILDLIQINPLWETTTTFPWRFLNPDRVSVLD